jgi:hypothetical protein
MPVITLTTDFGLRDGFVGVLKGVILGIAPNARIVDISHAIAPQDIRGGAFVLWRAFPYFPKNSIHLYVVDPGVGTQRRPLASRVGDHYFVGPDNGLLTPILEDAGHPPGPVEFFNLDKPEFWLTNVSNTFHGRDLFAPVAAHLCNGVSLNALGTRVTDPVRLELPRPEKTSHGWRAHIVWIDTFGNLMTDLPAAAVSSRPAARFRICGREIIGLVNSYGSAPAGDLVALVDSQGFIEVAQVNGAAAERLGASVGDLVEVILSE